MVPGSTLMYGSSFSRVTRMPRDSSSEAREAEAIPFPREETTPPVTNTYFVMLWGGAGDGGFYSIADDGSMTAPPGLPPQAEAGSPIGCTRITKWLVSP